MVNGEKAADAFAPPAETLEAEAKCYVWDTRGNGTGGCHRL